MITVYSRSVRGVSKVQHKADTALPNDAVWIDIDRCDETEIADVAKQLRLKIPALREVRLLDQRQQYYVERNAVFVMTPIVVGSQTGNPTAGVMMFIITPKVVVTLRKAESKALANFAESLKAYPELLDSSGSVFIGLADAIIDRLADLGEKVSYEMEQVSRLVFLESLQRSKSPGQGTADAWRKVLQGLGSTARLNHRILTALSGIDRMFGFMQQQTGASLLGAENLQRLALLQTEVEHLASQSESLVNEATFLLDAMVGAISIEQNNVIKVFSMVSVILMPPTMIASIYGMNFVHMPELNQVWAYPAALALMLVSAILPWWWFKRSGWF